MNTTGWLKGVQVTADGTGIVSHAGVALIMASARYASQAARHSRAGVRVLSDADVLQHSAEVNHRKLPERTGDDELAALIFTSGSGLRDR